MTDVEASTNPTLDLQGSDADANGEDVDDEVRLSSIVAVPMPFNSAHALRIANGCCVDRKYKR